MAKRSEGSKSQAIRDALRANREKTPTEIAAMLQARGLDVTPAYVSNVKFHTQHPKARARTSTVRAAARRTGRRKSATGHSFDGISAALEFVKAVGSLKAAKSSLATLEEISTAVR